MWKYYDSAHAIYCTRKLACMCPCMEQGTMHKFQKCKEENQKF